jgi:hypothetical protein
MSEKLTPEEEERWRQWFYDQEREAREAEERRSEEPVGA